MAETPTDAWTSADTDTRGQPPPRVPPNASGLAPVRPEDGPQDVSQEPGTIAVDPLLRAAPASRTLTAAAYLAEARSQLGYHEAVNGHTKYGQWYADRHHDQAFADANWCDMGASWAAAQVGAGAVVGEFAYTPWHAQWFAARGRFGRTPHPGDLVFFSWSGGKSIGDIEHVGIVESPRSDGRIVTIEFNTSDAVMRRVRTPAGIVVGYGSPDWAALDVADDAAEVVSLGA